MRIFSQFLLTSWLLESTGSSIIREKRESFVSVEDEKAFQLPDTSDLVYGVHYGFIIAGVVFILVAVDIALTILCCACGRSQKRQKRQKILKTRQEEQERQRKEQKKKEKEAKKKKKKERNKTNEEGEEKT